MANVPKMRTVSLEVALADVSRNPRPFLVINRKLYAEGEVKPPAALFERLPGKFDGDLLIARATIPELRAAHLSLARHREQFLAGEFVMMVTQPLHRTPERPHGGQDVVGLEKRARDGLYITVALATERLRACADCRERRKMRVETRRLEILARLEPYLVGLSAINVFREGQELAKDWYSGMKSSQALRSAYKSIDDLPGVRLGLANLAAVEEEQLDLVRTAGAVYGKALKFLETQHEVSAMIRKMKESEEFKNATPAQQYSMQAIFLREQAPALHQELAHDKQGGPSLAQCMRAAWSMDCNPAWVFTNVFAYKPEFDCAMSLGRAERGIGALLEATQIVGLRRFMELADASGTGIAVDAEVEAARYLRDLALRVKRRAAWDEFFTIADTDGGSLWLNKPL